jgi:hypothetical protein
MAKKATADAAQGADIAKETPVEVMKSKNAESEATAGMIGEVASPDENQVHESEEKKVESDGLAVSGGSVNLAQADESTATLSVKDSEGNELLNVPAGSKLVVEDVKESNKSKSVKDHTNSNLAQEASKVLGKSIQQEDQSEEVVVKKTSRKQDGPSRIAVLTAELAEVPEGDEEKLLAVKKRFASTVVGLLRRNPESTILHMPHHLAVHVINHPGVLFDQESKQLTYEGTTVSLAFVDKVEQFVLA